MWRILILASVAACGERSLETPTEAEPRSEVRTEAAHRPMDGARAQPCPMALDGVEVSTSDTEEGVALTFTTAGDPGALRQRVEHMAWMYGHHQGRPMMWGRGGGRGMHMGSPMPDATARFEEIEGGARVVLTPVDPADLDRLRQAARDHQGRMESGQCWTLQEA